ncbi:MAG: LBF_2804 family protein, partial [Nannocystaceae bacterium]
GMKLLYQRFFERLPVRAVEHDDAVHLLNEAEVRFIRNRHRVALSMAAALAVFGFLAYYLPVYYAPELFLKTSVTVFGMSVELLWVEWLWGVVLMVIELYLLVLVNIWTVHEMAVATGVLTPETNKRDASGLLGVALEEKNTELLKYGIDPFLGLNRGALFVFNLVMKLKGFIGNKILQYLIRRLSARLAVREVLDFIGMPIYMIINAWATHIILREAKVIIMGQQLVAHLASRLPKEVATTAEEHDLLYDTLRLIAVSKRDFHHNHFVLAKTLIESYSMEVEGLEELPDDYADRLRAAPEGLRRLCGLCLILGFVLDGLVTWRERRRLNELRDKGILRVEVEEVSEWAEAFVSGRGVEGLLAAHLMGSPV